MILRSVIYLLCIVSFGNIALAYTDSREAWSVENEGTIMAGTVTSDTSFLLTRVVLADEGEVFTFTEYFLDPKPDNGCPSINPTEDHLVKAKIGGQPRTLMAFCTPQTESNILSWAYVDSVSDKETLDLFIHQNKVEVILPNLTAMVTAKGFTKQYETLTGKTVRQPKAATNDSAFNPSEPLCKHIPEDKYTEILSLAIRADMLSHRFAFYGITMQSLSSWVQGDKEGVQLVFQQTLAECRNKPWKNFFDTYVSLVNARMND